MIRLPAGLLTLVFCGCSMGSGETYGFVATLGTDTTSVERITRTPTHIVGDAVGRSPMVTRRHWDAELAADGSVKKWSLDTYIPNADSADRHLHHTAEFLADRVALSRGTSDSTRKWAYKREFPSIVPWNAFLYGTYELLLDAARRQGGSARIGHYFFEGWDEGHIGYADVRRNRDGSSYLIGSTGLSGDGLARVDTLGRLASYSGAGTTYKQEVRRVADVPNLDSLTTRLAADEKAKGVATSLSPREIVHAAIGNAELTIDYGSPARRGRTLVGGLIPLGEVWRTGANAATQLKTSAPIRLAGVPLATGTYTLWTLPSKGGVDLIINKQSGQWGTDYRSNFDLARRPMKVDSVPGNVERFTIRIAQGAAGAGQLVMEWGTFRWAAPLAGGR